MVLLSALEDLLTRTFALFPTALEKLRYVAGLKKDGTYSHWGLERTHGEGMAHRAMAQAHKDVWLKILRTPLPALIAEVESIAARGDADATECVNRLYQERSTLLPAELGGGSVRHFNSVLSALSALVRAQRNANQSAA